MGAQVDQSSHQGEWMQVVLERWDRAVGDLDDCRHHACPLHRVHLCDLILVSLRAFE